MTTVLTAGRREVRPFPRWTLALLGIAFVVAVATGVRDTLAYDDGLNFRVQDGIVWLGLVAGCGIGAWAEGRLYDAGRSLGPTKRLLAGLASAPAALLVGIPLAILVGIGPALLGDGALVTVTLMFASLWAASAAVGSVVVIGLDTVVSKLVSGFRERVLAAVLSLVAIASVAAALCLVAADQLVRGIINGSVENASVDVGSGNLSGPELQAFLSSEEGYLTVVAVFASLAASFALPAVISACSKLADSVMEHVHPLAAAFREVSEGNLDVRVEEAGSREFAQLARDFNAMTDELTLATAMERSFGQYLSVKLLARIREQHGQARLPATLRDASVFFADVRGFTAMSETKEPTEVLDILNRYFERIIPVISAHDGYLDKFIGDEVFVVFNGPVDQPDHPERAATCALALQAEVARMNELGLFDEIGGIHIGIGLATGPLVAGNLGSHEQMEYTVIGDTVNLAARLTSQARAGQVIVNDANAARSGTVSTPLEAIKVKGKSLSLVPHLLTG